MKGAPNAAEHASRRAIEGAFAEDMGQSIYLLPLEARRSTLRTVDWVKDASVARIWPNRVLVTVDERNFRRFLASDMPEKSVAVIDLPAPPPTTRSIDPRYLVALTLLIGGAMVLALARALRRR